MSKIGRKPILLPAEVRVSVRQGRVEVKGPKGKLEVRLPAYLELREEKGKLFVRPRGGEKSKPRHQQKLKAFWGLTRALLANAVRGVKEGFKKKLELHGVGFRAQVQGKRLSLQVGFSHPVEIEAPAGIEFAVEKNVITVSGIDKQLVGEMAARIRKVRPPEPYKGKGIRYVGEVVRRKVGKVAAGAEAGGEGGS
jgi:large subunit ribosomal protein L6